MAEPLADSFEKLGIDVGGQRHFQLLDRGGIEAGLKCSDGFDSPGEGF
jgi:hypothetical protein